ncbi:MAG: C25 family cysteine peptidase, partial [Chitinophagaceae bacterium]
MKTFLPALIFLMLGCSLSAQVHNNEWIDYSKTYYKFKLGNNGLFRIPQSALSTIGLGSANASDFQLWKDGREVPIFTTQSLGPLDLNGYIQFYGTKNDGTLDSKLYKVDSIQMNNAFSLLTDSSSYFLTLNPGGENIRLVSTPNDLSGTLTPEPYFIYTKRRSFNEQLHRGYSLSLGELIYSSAFETGEGWGTEPISSSFPYIDNSPGMFIHPSASKIKFDATVAGGSLSSRTYLLHVNGQQVRSAFLSAFNISRTSDSIPVSSFTSNSASVMVTNMGAPPDGIVLSEYKLTYRRQFNFGGATSFAFDLPASPTSRYLEIQNFNYGSSAPVLFDIVNNFSISCDISLGTLRVTIPPMALPGKLFLSSTEPVAVNTITSFTPRNFINYALPANQGDYIIISHPLLYNGTNNIQNYKNYRAMPEGGGFNAKVVESDQLIDQFAFGVRHHPLSIRNFTGYALSFFTITPKYFFLLGKGLTYREFRLNENNSTINNLALVPTFGDPASDNLLTATRTTSTARIPVGRLSAITGDEVGKYLQKIKEYELAQKSTVQTVAAKGWMKNVAHLTGAINDPFLSYYIESFMDNYERSVKDTVFGANVFRFSKNLGSNNAIGTNKSIDSILHEGVSFLTYFGHSSANNLEFNLDDPSIYQNAGKYPVILINGCTTGNLFNYETIRSISGGTLSEKYIFAEQKGSVGFIATTHFGLLSPLHSFTNEFYKKMSGPLYGQSIGNLMKSSMESMMLLFPNDFTMRIHAEEITLHGDPAIKLNVHAKADYIINDSLVKITPEFISLADQKYDLRLKFLNIGRSILDSITVKVEHRDPSGTITPLATRRLLAPDYDDSLSLSVNINYLKHIGLNRIIVTLDADNDVDELSESNNTIIKEFTIESDDIRAIYPYNFSIINTQNTGLFASTADVAFGTREYVMEMDTTGSFNSPFKISRSVTDSGGVIKFIHNATLIDSTVYYWRVGLGPLTPSVRWSTSSFRFINSIDAGFNQSHFYQFKKDQFSGINIDSASRIWNFNNASRKLLIRTGLYPYYGYDQINVNVDDNLVDLYGCRYHVLQFVVFDPLTMQPWVNTNTAGSGRFGSWPPCNGTRKFFEFPYDVQSYRKKAMDFIDSIPTGYYFSMTNISNIDNTSFVDQWKADTATYGSGQSIYHKLKAQGFNQIDSFYHNIPFIFVGKKSEQASFPAF